MQNQADIRNWELLGQGAAIEFPGRNARPVTLHLNSAGKAAIYIQLKSEAKPRLLALVEGRDTVTFATDGPFAIMNKTDKVECYVLTRDGNAVHRVALDEEAYTTLHQPRARDENLERIMQQMNKSMNLRLAQERAQFERVLANERAKLAAETAPPVGGEPTEPNVGQSPPADAPPEDGANSGGS